MKKKMCIADFDKTLITVDSLVHIMFHEAWLFSPKIIICCLVIVILKITGKDTAKVRSLLKEQMLKHYYALPASKKDKYIRFFQTRLNGSVIDHITSAKPDIVVVVSASEESLIGDVLGNTLGDVSIIANNLSGNKIFETCWGKNKAKRLKSEYTHLSDYIIITYTDSYSDQSLIDISQEAWMVKGKDVSKIK